MCASAGTVSPVDYGTSKSTSISPVRRTPASVGARRYRCLFQYEQIMFLWHQMEMTVLQQARCLQWTMVRLNPR
ncbi:hypothetical protein BaRGS_00015267 [Batillaria attramentaria]|uniref:Uncharacterized protein n=1 Tax=Batillaria attramentaria TaxID=370345 RepID=A0ABD0L222_9CAEN